MRRTAFILLLLLGTFASATSALAASGSGAPGADLLIHNARIWTVDRERPEAQAVAVIGERIVAVGTNDEVDAWRGARTRVVDAAGKRLLPGFNDSHVHFSMAGFELEGVQLNDARSAQEFARRIGERARKFPREWIVGGRWDETKWTPAELPTRQLIDAVTRDVPVAVSRYDGHMILANSAALKLAGITRDTPDPPGGVIVRDANGEPTGAIKDAAIALIDKVIPAPSHEQRLRAARGALAHAVALGVTSVQDMDLAYEDIAAYADLRERGELTTRIYAAPGIAKVDDQAKLGLRRAFGDASLRVGALKGFADGSLGSSTAYFFEPFADQPGNRGILLDGMQPVTLMRDRMLAADKAGLQLCLHAIGDAGIAAILDLYEHVEKAHGRHDRRWRIEHAQHMAARDFERFAKLSVIASVQPYHAIDDGRWAEPRIGRDRASRTYAFRTFLDRGVRLALGTDWPVAPLDPLQTLYAAVTRATLDGKHPQGWVPEQKITIQEAIEAYTLGSAYAEFQDRDKGSISPGKLADMVLLSGDVLSIDPARLREVKVLQTWIGGRSVYSASN